MKLELLDKTGQGGSTIDSYGTGEVVIAGVVYRHSLIIDAVRGVQPWQPRHVTDLTPEHLEVIAQASPEIVLLGTGRHLQVPAASVLAPVTARHIGLEVMDTGAVCRSYNFLLGEGRQVIAAVLMIEP